MKMQKTIKTIFVGVVIAVLSQLNIAQVFAQREIRDDYTSTTSGGVTYTICHVYKWDKNERCYNSEGIKINGKQIVPCSYNSVSEMGNYFLAVLSAEDCRMDVYTMDGQLLFPASKGIVLATQLKNLDNKILFRDKVFRWYDEKGAYVCTGLELIEGYGKDVYIYTSNKYDFYANAQYYNCAWIHENKGKRGISSLDGNEILAPEFDGCEYLGDNFFAFYLNGYCGVMRRNGTIIIPLSRKYKSIKYIRSLKTFTFNKCHNGTWSEGECDANGVQKSINKAPKPTVSVPETDSRGNTVWQNKEVNPCGE